MVNPAEAAAQGTQTTHEVNFDYPEHPQHASPLQVRRVHDVVSLRQAARETAIDVTTVLVIKTLRRVPYRAIKTCLLPLVVYPTITSYFPLPLHPH